MDKKTLRNAWLRLFLVLAAAPMTFPFVAPMLTIVQREPIYPEAHDSLVAVGLPTLPDTGAVTITLKSQPFGAETARLTIRVHADELDPLDENPTVVLAGPIAQSLGTCSGAGAATPVAESFGQLSRVSKSALMAHYFSVLREESKSTGKTSGSLFDIDERVQHERFTEFELEPHLEDYKYSDSAGATTHVQRQTVVTTCDIGREGLWEVNGPEARLAVPRLLLLTPKRNALETPFTASATISLTSGVVLVGQSNPPTSSTSSEVVWTDVGPKYDVPQADFSQKRMEPTSAVFRDGRLAQKDQNNILVGGIALGILGSVAVAVIPLLFDAVVTSFEYRSRVSATVGEIEGPGTGDGESFSI